jgi:hypothetical protein
MANNPVIEEHLGRIAAGLRLRGRYRDRVMIELQAHLEDAVNAGVADGRSHAEATELGRRRDARRGRTVPTRQGLPPTPVAAALPHAVGADAPSTPDHMIPQEAATKVHGQRVILARLG